MTPDQIEEALEQPEFNKPLQILAKAEIALEQAAEVFQSALGATYHFEGAVATLADEIGDAVHDFAYDVSESFPETSFDRQEIILEAYKGIKANLLKPENIIKEALS